MKEYTIARATGEILQNNIGYQLPNLILFEPGCYYVEGLVSNATHYLLDGIATPYPVMPTILDAEDIVADGVALATLSGLPNPSRVSFAGTDYTVIDGQFEVSFDLPGTHKIKVASFPYLSTTFEVTAL